MGGCKTSQSTERVSPPQVTEKPTIPDKPAPPPTEPPAGAIFQLCAAGLPVKEMWKCDPVLADVNSDGHLDLAGIPRLGKGPAVWLGDGQGGWQRSAEGLTPGLTSCGGGLELADVNDDGNLDLVVADHCQGIYVYLGDGNGAWTMVTEALFPTELLSGSVRQMFTGAEDLAVADLDNDGYLDIIAGSSDEGGINLYTGDGTGRNWTRTPTDLPTRGWANRLTLFDVNDDGRLDLVAAYCEGPRVWLGDNMGGWLPASEGLPTPRVQGLYTGLGLGDVNGDGLTDLAVANWVDGPEVYLQQTDGSWHKTADVFPRMRGGAIGLALGDVDGDGHLDLAVTGRLDATAGLTRGVFLLLGNGAGGWTYVPGSGLASTGLLATSGVELGDVNGDGVLDVAASSGLMVETAPGEQQPAIAQRMLVWCSIPGGG
jgi:hypothetical protein